MREAIEGLGGRAWSSFAEDGRTRFLLALPRRRAIDPTAGDPPD